MCPEGPTEAVPQLRSDESLGRQKGLAVIVALADHERRVAVVSEVKFKVQAGAVATQFGFVCLK